MRAAFDGKGAAWSEDNLHRIYTTVKPGFIRVDADEVTYPLHVMLRYRLERALLAGELKLADLPGAWNEGMKQSLGIVPPDDRLGCLQDIHWPDGAFGYFPTYTLGAMAAAQLYAAACKEQPQVPPGIAAGDFSPLFAWLRANVHGKGSLLDTDTLLQEATGAPLGTAAFRAHLERRYLTN
jgi:carboxypeptidase Taq